MPLEVQVLSRAQIETSSELRTGGRRDGEQMGASLRDELGRGGHGKAGGFVTNCMVRSDFFDEGGNFGEIAG